jgi:hypothetical protein
MKNQLMMNKKLLEGSTLLKKKQHIWQSELRKKGLPIWREKISTIETKSQSSRN